MLDRVLDAVRGSRVARSIIVLGDAAERVRAELGLEKDSVVVNREYEAGMSSSLKAGVAALPSEAGAFFVVLGDEPFVRSETYNALISARESTGARVILPTYLGVRGNPVLVDRSLAGEVEAITGDRGCRELRQHHPDETVEVAVDDPGILIDIDTPEDVARARRALDEGQPVSSLVREFTRPRSDASEPASSQLPRMRGRESVPGTVGDPERQLVVVGGSRVSENLSALGRLLGFRVVVAGSEVDPSRFPDADELVSDIEELAAKVDSETYAVVSTMATYDARVLAVLLRSTTPYIGLVANRRRAAALRTNLLREGFGSPELDRLQSPAGLDIRAETPEEIALSVAAEIVRRIRTRPESPSTTETAAPILRTVLDPVCGKSVDPSVSARRTEHAGTTFWFCSEGCLRRFSADPWLFVEPLRPTG